MTISLSRTFLFVPGNHPSRVDKALMSDADAAILDLEDAVAETEKVATRALVVAALQRPRRARGLVRINSLDTAYAFGDLHAVVQKGVDGIVLPKLESAAQLYTVDWIVGNLERERGLDSIELMPILETGAGFSAIDAIARHAALHTPRVRRLAFGAGDFCLDMNLVWTADETELQPFRASIVLASRAAGLEPPVDTVWVRLDDADGMARSAARGRGLGFQGKLCIHPSQLQAANAVFSPAADEIRRAREIVEVFRRAEAEGVASIRLNGEFIDYPIVHRAERVLAVAAYLDARGVARA